MAESTLSTDYDQLRREIGRHMGWNRTPGSWTTNQTADGDDILMSGYRMFLTAYDWSFLRIANTLATVAEYSTGTVVVASGVVTLSGGTFPSWAASGEITLDNQSATYTIDTRDSDTQVTLDDTSLTDATASVFNLTRPWYDLPDDYAGMLGPLTWQTGTQSSYPPVEQINENQLRQQRMYVEYTNQPRYFAIRAKNLIMTDGQRFEIGFYPVPDAVYNFDYLYQSNPSKLDSTNDTPAGGMLHSETITQAILAKADEKLNDTAQGSAHASYQQHLENSKRIDMQMNAADHLGYDADIESIGYYINGAEQAQWWGTGLQNYTGHTLYRGPWS